MYPSLLSGELLTSVVHGMPDETRVCNESPGCAFVVRQTRLKVSHLFCPFKIIGKKGSTLTSFCCVKFYKSQMPPTDLRECLGLVSVILQSSYDKLIQEVFVLLFRPLRCCFNQINRWDGRIESQNEQPLCKSYF